MSRLLLAALTALVFHAVVLAWYPKGFRSPSVPPMRQEPLSLSLTSLVPQGGPAEKPMVRREDPTPLSTESKRPAPGKPESRIPSRYGKDSAKPPEEASEPIQPRVSTSQHTETSALAETTWIAKSPESSSTPSTREARFLSPSGAADISPSSLPLKEAMPIYKSNPAPDYPAVARRRGFEGTVILEALVNRDGRVTDLRLLQSSGHAVLDQAALSSVKGWVFDPARRGEEAVEMWVRIPIRFRLRDG